MATRVISGSACIGPNCPNTTQVSGDGPPGPQGSAGPAGPAGPPGNELWTSIDDFGASRNPLVDSTAAIQSALNAASASGGGWVLVPNVNLGAGEGYGVYSTVTIPPNVALFGTDGADGNAALIRSFVAANDVVFQFAAGLNRSAIEGLQILGQSGAPAGIAVSFTGSQYNYAKNLQIWYHQIGIDLSDGVTPFSAYNVIEQCEINLSTLFGIRAYQSANSNAIIGGRVFFTRNAGNTAVALGIDSARALSISGGLALEDYNVGLQIGGAPSFSMTGCWFEKGATIPLGADFDVLSTFAESPFFEGGILFDGNHYVDQWPLDTGILSVKQWGALGNGVDNDTAKIQACIDAAIARGPGTAVFFPSGTYISGNLNINNATDLRVYGNDATLEWTGAVVAPNRIGLRLLGTCTRVQIEHLRMVGDGLVASRHVGVYSSSGSFLQSCSISYCSISEVTLGISMDMTSAGSYARGCVVEHNVIEHVVGIEAGFGYGIHFADGSGQPAGHSVLYNEIHRAQRHSIYMALGSTVLVHGNKIFDHRDELDDGAVRYAVNLSRTRFFVVTNNQIIRSHNTSVGIAADAGGIAEHVIFANNEIILPFVNPLFPVPCMEVGLDIDTNGQANDVLIEGNKIVTDGTVDVDALRLNWGRRIVVRGNSIEMTNANASTYGMNLRGVGEGVGTTDFSDDWTIQDNSFRILDGALAPTGAGIRLSPPYLDSGIRTTLGGSYGGGRNRFVALAEYSLAATLTNPNVYAWEGQQLSWSTATGPATNPTRAANATSESVDNRTGIVLENTGATSLSTLTGGFEGKEITLWFANGNTTLVHNAGGSNAMQLIPAVNWTPPTGASIRLKLIRGQWRELARFGNPDQVAAFTALGSVTFPTPGTGIFLGDGSTAGNIFIEGRKADANALTWLQLRNGTAAAGLRWLVQFASDENVSFQRYDNAGAFVDTPMTWNWTTGVVAFNQISSPLISGNMQMVTAGQLFIFGDGATSGNVGIEYRKADANNLSYETWRVGTAAAGLRAIWQWDTAENWNFLVADDAGSLLAITPLQISRNAVNGRTGVRVARLYADRGTTLVNGDWALSAGWGNAATAVVSTLAKGQRGEVTFTSAGTGQAANPTATLTFPEGTWTSAPEPIVVRNGGTGTGITGFTFACTATTLVITAVGTPVAGETYIVRWMLMG